MNRLNLVLGALFLLTAGAAQAADDLHITRIVPQGDDLRAQRQITISFDRAVVPLGRMERTADEVPVTVTPDPGCEWRWLDSQVLACNLANGNALKDATAYSIEVKPGLTALDGAVLRKGMTRAFMTERPRVLYAQVVAWRAPQQPELRVRFNQAVTAKSVAANLKLGKAIEVGPDLFDADTPFYTPDGEARVQWRIWPTQALQPDQSYSLSVSPGLVSAFGMEPGLKSDGEFTAHMFPELRLLGLRCTIDGEEQTFAVDEDASGCVPLAPISLEFSAPVSTSALREHFKIDPSPAMPTDPDFDPWANSGDSHPVSWPHNENQTYRVYLPYALAAESAYTISVNGALVDRFGRALQQDAAIKLRTGARAPNFVADHPVAVLESGESTEVPVIVTNLESIVARYTRMSATGDGAQLEADQALSVPVSPVRNVAFAMPLNVRGMLGGQDSGALRGTLEAQAKGGVAIETNPREFFVTVTPWQIHAKIGHSNSLVWVTGLADGKPVADAEVAIVEGLDNTARATARTDASGVAMLPGTAVLDPKLEKLWVSGKDSLGVRVQHGKQLALLPLQSAFDVDIWRASREQFWS
ncbi:MAG: hypothetical protein M3O62_06500, partial [Pseudomonadota bacterium]|nr:hypothetical protein [Pseudomonadota bacterium]